MTVDVAKYKERLEERLKELDVRLHRIEDDLDAEVSADFEDRATEREGDETLEGLGMSGVEEMRRIRAALDRIKAGTFGVCAECGETILSERLDIVPHASLCRNCARAH